VASSAGSRYRFLKARPLKMRNCVQRLARLRPLISLSASTSGRTLVESACAFNSFERSLSSYALTNSARNGGSGVGASGVLPKRRDVRFRMDEAILEGGLLRAISSGSTEARAKRIGRVRPRSSSRR
jgi:hypothetical protein